MKLTWVMYEDTTRFDNYIRKRLIKWKREAFLGIENKIRRNKPENFKVLEEIIIMLIYIPYAIFFHLRSKI